MRGADDYIGEGRALSFIEAMTRAQPWTAEAACAVEPYSSWRAWTIEPSRGMENPGTVVKCFAVCAACPVRRQCLESALRERRFVPTGVFGGTTMTERRAAWRERIAEFKPDASVRIPSSSLTGEPAGTVDAGVNAAALTDSGRERCVQELADSFDASFADRLEAWIARMPPSKRAA